MDQSQAKATFEQAQALLAQGQGDRALPLLQSVLAVFPNNHATHFLMGLALSATGQHAAAMTSFDRALSLKDAFPDAHFARGVALAHLGRMDDALASYDRAITLRPTYLEALYNRGMTLYGLGQYEQAAASYAQAIAAHPTFAEAYAERGLCLFALKRKGDALANYDQAIALKPNYAQPYFNRANLLLESQRYTEALSDYTQALACDPNLTSAKGMAALCKAYVCDWASFDADVTGLAADIKAARAAYMPFGLLSFPFTLEQQRRNAEAFSKQMLPAQTPYATGAAKSHQGKIRIGYFSSDFFNHATMYLMAELFERHDKSKFEVFGFSYSQAANDDMRDRAARSFDQFHDVRDKTDADIVALARSLNLHIAVDLKGYTNHFRLGFFAQRIAPVQVHYLGYPGTLGTPCIDYLMADPTLIPPDHRTHYAEKIAYMPVTYQVNDRQRKIATHVPSRAAVGLPENVVVFCSFNNNFKITPATFDVWMRILSRVDGAVLWLLRDNGVAENNLKLEANARNIDPSRLIFADRVKLPDHLARHALADLALDTFDYGGHTTTSDALWAGLPVITCLGRTFAGRVGGSLLRAANLPELVCDTVQAYEDLAVSLAQHPSRLRDMKRILTTHRDTCALFDVARFTKDLEALYAQMWARHMNGERPDHIGAVTI